MKWSVTKHAHLGSWSVAMCFDWRWSSSYVAISTKMNPCLPGCIFGHQSYIQANTSWAWREVFFMDIDGRRSACWHWSTLSARSISCDSSSSECVIDSVHYGREVKQGTFPTALLAVWRFANVLQSDPKFPHQTHSQNMRVPQPKAVSQSEDVYQHWSIFNIPIDLLQSTSLALMSLEIQNLRLSPGIIVVKPRFKAPNSQTNAPSSSLSLGFTHFHPGQAWCGRPPS